MPVFVEASGMPSNPIRIRSQSIDYTESVKSAKSVDGSDGRPWYSENSEGCCVANQALRQHLDPAGARRQTIRQTKCDLAELQISKLRDVHWGNIERIVITVDQINQHR